MRLSYRINVIISLAIVSAIALTTILSVYKFETTFSKILTARFEFQLEEMRRNVEAKLDLGLTLANLSGISQMFEERLASNAQIVSIELFDATGTVLYSTDPSFVGDLVAQQWVDAWHTSKEHMVWVLEDANAGVVGRSLQNSLGQNIGAIVLKYSRHLIDKTVSNLARHLAIDGAIASLSLVVIGLIGVVCLIRKPCMQLGVLTRMADSLADPGMKTPEPLPSVNAPENFEQFRHTVRRTYRHLTDTERTVQSIDEEG